MCPFQICDHTTQYADLAKLSHEVLEFDDIPCMPAEELETIMTGPVMAKDGLHRLGLSTVDKKKGKPLLPKKA